MTVTKITRLELRAEEIPRSPLIERLERELGRPLTHEVRHYLEGLPVHCGEILQLQIDGQWVTGRYEWGGTPEDVPTFHYDGGVLWIDDNCLVRWPKKKP
jgi:hypothetical protein